MLSVLLMHAPTLYAPSQIMRAHLPHDEWFGLALAAFLGSLALLGGLANIFYVARGNKEPNPNGPGRRWDLGSGIIGVLVGSYFLWVSMIYIRPRAGQEARTQQIETLHQYLFEHLTDIPLSVFLDYVRVGAVGINDDLGNGSALSIFVENRDPAAIHTLMAAGASPNGRGNGQSTPLIQAVDHNDLGSVRLLLALHANPNLAAGTDAEADNLPIFDAVNPPGDDEANDFRSDSDHSQEIVAALVAAGANLNLRDSRSYTPLMIAAATGRCDLVATLLGGNPDETLPATTGETALDWANSEHPECAPLLAGGRASKAAIAATLAAASRAQTADDEANGSPCAAQRLARYRSELERRRAQSFAAYLEQQRKANALHPGRWLGGIVSEGLWRLFLWLGFSIFVFVIHHVQKFVRGKLHASKQPTLT